MVKSPMLQHGKGHIIHMFNALGQEVGVYKISNDNDRIDVSGVQKGMYLIRDEDSGLTQHLVID